MRRAFLLAGGQGLRLRPLTTVLPKPLLPLGDRTILENLLEGLARSGLRDVTISLGYLGHLVEAVLGNGERFGLSIQYTRETEPLGTAGALSLLSPLNPDDAVLVVNGDTYTDFDFNQAFDEFDRTHADALVVCARRSGSIDFGVVEVNSDGSLSTYVEKPEFSYLVSTGINVIRGSSSRHVHRSRIDMPDLLRLIQQAGGRVQCLETSAVWLDLGRLEDLETANEMAYQAEASERR